MSLQTTKDKGSLLEDHVAERIVSFGLDPTAVRDGGSGNGNREKGDIKTSFTILGRNAGIECKNHLNLAIPQWWRQAEKLQVIGREPVLVFKIHGDTIKEAKAMVYLDTLLELVRLANLASGIELKSTTRPEKNRELKWALQNLKTAAKKVDKLIELSTSERLQY